MKIHQQIKVEIKQAMLEKNQVKLGVVRGIIAAFTNDLVAKKRKPDEWLGDEDALAVIKRLVRQRKDSIEQFTTGGRTDLAEAETAELAYLETYLPATMSHAEIEKIAREKITALGLTQKTQAGQLMAALMKDLRGQADGGDVKAVVDQLLV